MIGKTFYNFFLPIMLISILEFKETRSLKNKIIFIIIAILISNFFPSIDRIQKLMGERGENIYINGFNAVYINPLGWEICQIPTLRSKLEKIYSNSKFESESSLYIAEKLHFHTKLALEFPVNYFFPFPSIYRLDNLPPDRIKVLLDKYRKIGEEMFFQWLDENKIQLLLIGQKNFTSFVGDPPNIQSLIKKDSDDLNDIARSISRAFLEFVEQGKYLHKDYDCQLLPKQNPRLKVCISKKLEKKTVNENHWNRHLSDLASRYEMTQRRPLPNWINKLDDENRMRLSQKRAGAIYDELEKGQERLSKAKIYVKLRKIIELDPAHVGALEDILALQEKLTKKDWILLSKKYQPIDPTALEKALTSVTTKHLNPEFELLKVLSNDQKAHHLFILSNRYFHSDPKRCMDLLTQVLKLKPDHSEAQKDLTVLKKQIQSLRN